jgi:hypothetical protein
MGSLSSGGGSSAVAASAHAGCERYRHTDPMLTGHSRRELAKRFGHPDTTAGIPEGRWMRAMAFERLVRHDRFVSQLLTTAVGRLGLDRPVDVHRADGGVAPDITALRLEAAHERAVTNGSATMITGLAIPFVGLEAIDATPVKPDFAIVVPRPIEGGSPGSWIIMGDAKDYERVRSSIDDNRMLKGFLQVALGAESAAAWSKLPSGMEVHGWGALAVPRNAFLQPEAVVEQLDDHRREVRARVDERAELRADLGHEIKDEALENFVSHRVATYDPESCPSCAFFEYCRAQIRAPTDPHDLLVEIGIRPELRASVAGMVDGVGPAGVAPPAIVAQVQATLTGRPVWTGLRRVDPVGLPGSVNLVLAKSDAAALGVHGMAWQRVQPDGAATPWELRVFSDPQAASTRVEVMEIIGSALQCAAEELESAGDARPLHIVAPDGATADVLVSIADSLAGVETSRLRWQQDIDQGRPALTFDGEPAVVPDPLGDLQRLAVSFLLDQDRARAMTLRCSIVDARRVFAEHVVAGGPAIDSGRLDYLVEWAGASEKLDHRAVSDDIRSRESTPGAKLSNVRSDDIHRALRGRLDRGKKGQPDPARYDALVRTELEYKCATLSRAASTLADIESSKLRDAHLALEADAQEVWRRRLALHASDLVRFGRTSTVWRTSQVEMLENDRACGTKLSALANAHVAVDSALAAGTRELAVAEVVDLEPLRVHVRSRRIVDGSTAVALHINDRPCVEDSSTTIRVQQGTIKLAHMSVGTLVDDGAGALRWDVVEPLDVRIGDLVIVADGSWFNTFQSGHEISFDRPRPDTQSAPKSTCQPDSFATDREEHRWCCRSHEEAEAEWSDELAARRVRGELNPRVWPPVIDDDQFDTTADGSPTDTTMSEDSPVAAELTIDELE